MSSFGHIDIAYLYNTTKNLQERVSLLEEALDKLNKERQDAIIEVCENSNSIPLMSCADTIYGTHSFLDCVRPSEGTGKRTRDFYEK